MEGHCSHALRDPWGRVGRGLQTMGLGHLRILVCWSPLVHIQGVHCYVTTRGGKEVKFQNNGVQEKIPKAFRDRNQQTQSCLNPPWPQKKHRHLCFEGSCLPGIRGLAKPPIRLEVRIRIFFQKCRFPKGVTSLLTFSRKILSQCAPPRQGGKGKKGRAP